jgi:hypothetical protein
MAKTKQKKVYFGCRLSSSVVEQVRESARVSGRTIGNHLERILVYALPSFREMDTAIEQERRQAFRQQDLKAKREAKGGKQRGD